MLQNLLILDGERLSYRTLDVEQIGSVYETMMGFNLEVAAGPLDRHQAHEAPRRADHDQPGGTPRRQARRPGKWLKEQYRPGGDRPGRHRPEGRQDARGRRRGPGEEGRPRGHAQHRPAGAMILQPTDERRRSGSHYTPRSLTEPIVRTTLRPILERLGPNPTPEQILDLKVCDPAMGSGAFLVEACRQLAEALVKAWHAHDCVPSIPPDEDEILHARRIVAQRCLYGVDKNPMAVDLAKLSLWLATLAKDHPFTFLDHALRRGDSLVGLSREQIEGFHWKPEKQRDFARRVIEGKIRRGHEGRLRIQNASEFEPVPEARPGAGPRRGRLDRPRFYGDLVDLGILRRVERPPAARTGSTNWPRTLAAPPGQPRFPQALSALGCSAGEASLGREARSCRFTGRSSSPRCSAGRIRGSMRSSATRRSREEHEGLGIMRDGYLDWLKTIHDESHGNADLVAHFFRRAFNLLRHDGAFGLIATNTIGQGDTRSTGLRWICNHGGTIYAATRRKKWPGRRPWSSVWFMSQKEAASGAITGSMAATCRSSRPISSTRAATTTRPGSRPMRARAFGELVLGMGFTFDDTDTKGVANADRRDAPS